MFDFPSTLLSELGLALDEAAEAVSESETTGFNYNKTMSSSSASVSRTNPDSDSTGDNEIKDEHKHKRRVLPKLTELSPEFFAEFCAPDNFDNTREVSLKGCLSEEDVRLL